MWDVVLFMSGCMGQSHAGAHGCVYNNTFSLGMYSALQRKVCDVVNIRNVLVLFRRDTGLEGRSHVCRDTTLDALCTCASATTGVVCSRSGRELFAIRSQVVAVASAKRVA